MSTAVRQVRAGDLDRCLSIEQACFPESEAASRESIKKRIDGYPEGFLVLEVDQDLVGFINGAAIHGEDLSQEELKVLEGHDPQAPNLVVFSVAIVPEHRGKGLSSLLLSDYFGRAASLNKKSILLICKRKLVSYYERFGFTDLGRSPSSHGGAQWFQMKKVL